MTLVNNIRRIRELEIYEPHEIVSLMINFLTDGQIEQIARLIEHGYTKEQIINMEVN